MFILFLCRQLEKNEFTHRNRDAQESTRTREKHTPRHVSHIQHDPFPCTHTPRKARACTGQQGRRERIAHIIPSTSSLLASIQGGLIMDMQARCLARHSPTATRCPTSAGSRSRLQRAKGQRPDLLSSQSTSTFVFQSTPRHA